MLVQTRTHVCVQRPTRMDGWPRRFWSSAIDPGCYTPTPPHPSIHLHHPLFYPKQDITIYGIQAELFDDPAAAQSLHEERHMIKWRGEVGGWV